MGYEGRVIGKPGKVIQETIQPIMRPKNKGLGYGMKKRSDVASIRILLKLAQRMQCSHYRREYHKEDKCWDLHPCSICGLKNHCEKSCWNKETNGQSRKGCM